MKTRLDVILETVSAILETHDNPPKGLGPEDGVGPSAPIQPHERFIRRTRGAYGTEKDRLYGVVDRYGPDRARDLFVRARVDPSSAEEALRAYRAAQQSWRDEDAVDWAMERRAEG